MECFLRTNVKVNTLSTKVCLLKLKRHTPLASNLSEIAILYLHALAKLKNLFSLLLKLKLEKINISVSLESDGVIFVSVNPVMSFFIILSSLTIYQHVL